MGIVNITPDSFYAQSRCDNETEVLKRVENILNEGGSMIDIGAYSSRPGAADISADEEIARLLPSLYLIRKYYPDVPVSIDTFRADVAQKAITEGDADMINDISGGEMDSNMFDTVARLHVPYILMHMQGTPQTMQHEPVYKHLMNEILLWLSHKVDALKARGVNDIIIDPGFGFGKTVEHNYELMSKLSQFVIFELPLLVGISRKSMIYRLLNTTPEQSLNGTTILNTFALLGGANILRVHDVKEAAECVTLTRKIAEY
jgi:dihydropteroate synthase